MAKSKNKNEISIINIKKNSNVIKKGSNAVVLNKKRPISKKNLSDDVEIKENMNILQQESIQKRKERNRKKYQNQQKKYNETNKNKPKKKIVIDDVENKKKNSINVDEPIIKKEKKIKVKKKDEVVREKRKEKRKINKISETIVSIKTLGADTINNVKEKTGDNNIPVGITKEEKKKRFKRLLEESIVFAIILTIINIIVITFFEDANFLRLFDVKALNIVVTIIISLLFNFFIAFAVDYFVTALWVKLKRKKGDDNNGNSGVNKEEYREDIEVEKRK